MNKILLLIIFVIVQGFSESNFTEQVKDTLNKLIPSSIETSDDGSNELLSLEQKIADEKKRELLEKQIVKQKAIKALEEKKYQESLEKQKAEAKMRVKVEERLETLLKEKKEIDDFLVKDDLWSSVYSNHETYLRLQTQLISISKRIKKFEGHKSHKRGKRSDYEDALDDYKTTKGKLSQLQEYRDDPFSVLLAPPETGLEPKIANPVDIISAMSFKKRMELVKEEYEKRYESLQEAVIQLERKEDILSELSIMKDDKIYINELRTTERKLEDYQRSLDIFQTTVKAFRKKVKQINHTIQEGIDLEIEKSIFTGLIILFLLLFFLLVKFIVKKYMSENDLFYGTNKVINFIFIALIFVILLFSYIDNVEHIVTVLSFASAGIAIALKDWFMSLLGWFVILVSGSIHVGDRMKFTKNGVEYVGDIVDISVLRMTLHEDVTLTTIYHNRRTGRIIFIPNNYIFTDMIANYSHSGLKTVWDGIDFFITFDSNISKAQHIAKEVTRKYSKGYTDMTRKQLNRLRSKYSMRNTAVEPRIFGFFDTYGVRISAWYLTNAFATLTLRSTISMEILARLQEEDDIFLALPSQSIYMDKPAPRLVLDGGEEPTAYHKPSNDSGTGA